MASPAIARSTHEVGGCCMEKRVEKVETTLYGNGRPGLVETHAKMLGYIKGCAAVGGVLLALILLVLTVMFNSISSIETSLRSHAQVVQQNHESNPAPLASAHRTPAQP